MLHIIEKKVIAPKKNVTWFAIAKTKKYINLMKKNIGKIVY